MARIWDDDCHGDGGDVVGYDSGDGGGDGDAEAKIWGKVDLEPRSPICGFLRPETMQCIECRSRHHS